MKLLRFSVRKKIFVPVFLFLATFIFAKSAFADCGINQCLWPEHGQTGTCEVGTVLQCDDGWKECIGTDWVDTTKREPLDKCSVSYRTGGWYEPAYEDDLQRLQEDAETGAISGRSYIAWMLNSIQSEGIRLVKDKAIGGTSHLIAGLYINRPISSKEYLADLGQNLGIVRPVYAQGGFAFLQPVLELWKLARNISYLLFALVLALIGTMVMFRTRIDPRTVTTVQEALPRVVIALVLVTFSYAIAGLMVDLAYVLNGLITKAFIQAPPINQYITLRITMDGQREPFLNADPGEIIDVFLGYAFKGLDITELVGGVTLGLIFFFVVLFSAFKIFFSLLGKYVMILISTLFAPFAFLWGTLPGQADHLTGWFTGLLSSVIVFPITYLLFNIALFFLAWGDVAAKNAGVAGPSFQKLIPLDPGDVFGGGVGVPGKTSQMFAGKLIALGIVLALPRVPAIIDDALKIKPSAGIGEGLRDAAKHVPIIGSFIGG